MIADCLGMNNTDISDTVTRRPIKCEDYPEKQLSKAVTAVKEGSMSIREAAASFDVPKSTLGD